MTKENDRQGVALSEKRILEIAQPWFGEETKHLRLHLVEFALAVARAAYPSARTSSSRAEVERERELSNAIEQVSGALELCEPEDEAAFTIIKAALSSKEIEAERLQWLLDRIDSCRLFKRKKAWFCMPNHSLIGDGHETAREAIDAAMLAAAEAPKGDQS